MIPYDEDQSLGGNPSSHFIHFSNIFSIIDIIIKWFHEIRHPTYITDVIRTIQDV